MIYGFLDTDIGGYPLSSYRWWLPIILLVAMAGMIVGVVFLAKFLNKKWMKPVLIPVVAVLTVLSSAAGFIVNTPAWSPLWMAITGNKSVQPLDSEDTKLAAKEAEENIVEIAKEGITLLKNDHNCLPLSQEESTKVNIFGAGAYGMFYGNGGSGAVQTTYRPRSGHPDRKVVKFEEAMQEEGFEINPLLFNLVKNYFPETAGNTDTSNSDRPSRTPYSTADSNNVIECGVNTYGYAEIVRTCLPYNHEPEVSAYTQSYAETGGKTLLEQAKEYSNTAIFCISRYGTESQDMNTSELTLKQNEREVINMLKENFEKVIILLNVSHAMEIGEFDDEGIDAVLLIGQPGITGNRALAKILKGEVNPSGKLADTWAYSAKSAPSYQSCGNDTTLTYQGKSGRSNNYVEYTEGIYVGYRYYVTRGMTDPDYKYEEEVQYSFGHGLSYTTFDKWIESTKYNEETGKYEVVVRVKNTGNAAGKDVIELYCHAPYTGAIEKSYYSLTAFQKTSVIEPGETKGYQLEFSYRDIASWDTENGYYVCEAGEYEMSIRDNVWKQAVTEEPKASTSFTFNIEKQEFKTSYQTGVEYSKQFEVAEFGPTDEPIQYLKRNDWAGTWTNTDDIRGITRDASHDENIQIEKRAWGDDQWEDLEWSTDTGIDNELTLADLKGASWDDERWMLLIDQMSVADLENLVEHGGFQTAKIDSIQKAKATDYDGPAAAFHSGSGHPCGVIVANTWNTNAALLFGESVGKEGAAAGLTGWYAPGVNIHRSPYGGRNFEYYSEDPLISGLMAGWTNKGTMEFGVYSYCKHMALNDQEKGREEINTWANEQSIREIYLRPFEIYSDMGGMGFMSSFNRIGDLWAGAHQGMLTNVARGEWGFHGVVVTDYVSGSYMDVAAGLRAGNDLWLDPNNTSRNAVTAYNKSPNDMTRLMKRSAKNILFACAHSNNVWSDEDWAAAGLTNPNAK